MDTLTAVILCGGKGERLRPFTEQYPKPLLPLNGRPILHYLLDYLHHNGVTRFILCTGYKAEAIEQFVAEGCDPAWQIRCVNSGDASMTQRMRDAWPHVQGRALVCYGDTLANVSLERLLRQHHKRRGLVTMALYQPRSPFGVVRFDRSKRIRQFVEKPPLPQWINIGFMLCEADSVRPYLEAAPDMVAFLEALVEAGVLFAYEHSGQHLTINTEKERQQAERDVVEFLSVLDS